MLGYWPYAGKQNIFHFIFFFWCLDENRVFSYRTCIFIVQKYNLAENHRFFKYIFEENFLNGPDPAQKENGPKSAQK
jgi:hypothetical protein